MKKITVSVATVDQYMAEAGVGTIGVLKIDTEGNEIAVLQGAGDAISRGSIDHIYLEFNSIASSQLGLPLSDAANILEQGGYRFIATYTDSVAFDEAEHVVANALFTRLRGRAAVRANPV